jgi:transcription factor SPN1
MSDVDSPAGSASEKPVDDGQEQEYEDELEAANSDHESDRLSEVDENQFEDYDPETANIEDRPVDIDEDVARTLKATKRKRVDGEVPKKPREGRREKKRRNRDDDTANVEVSDVEGARPMQRRPRKADDGERRAKAQSVEPERDEDLTPDERRKRAIDRALDSAMKKNGPAKRRRKDEIVGVTAWAIRTRQLTSI